MRLSYRMALCCALAAAIASPALSQNAPAPAAPVAPSKDRAVEQYLCKDVMRESGADRDVAIAFLHGYLLGKSGSSKFNIDMVHKQTEAFIDMCLNNPNQLALDAMQKVKQ